MACDEFGPDAHLVQQRRQAQAQSLHAHQVHFLVEQPAGVIFAKTGGLHQGQALVFESVGLEDRYGLGKHGRPLTKEEQAEGEKSHAPINVLDADDVVLAEIGAGLHLDQLQVDLARIDQAMHRADRQID